MPHPASPNPKKLRWLFVIISLGLIVQWRFASSSQEPYPALIYPAFTALSVTNGQLKIDKTEIVITSKGQAPVRVEAQRFFQALPKAFVESVLVTIAQRANPTVKTAQLRIGPYQFEIKGALSQDPHMLAAFQEWLKQEIKHTLQIDEPTQLTINTYQSQLDLAGQMTREAQLRNRLIIELPTGEAE